MAIQIGTIGFVFGLLFGADLTTYFPFLAVSLVLWNLMVSSLTEASSIYVLSERFLRQIELPSFFAILRQISKSSFSFLHNFAIVLVTLVVYRDAWNLEVLLVTAGLALIMGNLYWVVTLIAFGGARFRDLGPIVVSVMTVSFYVTPVIWMPSSLPQELMNVVLPYNPFFHLMEIVRGPLLGYAPDAQSWIVAGVMMVVGNAIVWLVGRRYWWRVVYWL